MQVAYRGEAPTQSAATELSRPDMRDNFYWFS
jgi:hypothetical protein